ncbi:MAG: MetQ/NlpA family lipoprotein [Crocinitomicaceae bacterium]|nr:MetQ/NlpA family lipoprotein [Crocinitomicaceae bacterium]NCA20410.1 MetQ/NlpA family lipoprotein [Crocinitomicaceae bacterium]
MKKSLFIIGILISSALLNACGSNKKNDPNHIVVGITSGPERELAEAAKIEAKKRFGLEVELVTFNDYVMPNEALNQGDIDVNVYQHVPYLKEQYKQRNYKFAVIGNTFVYPIVGYSKKIKKIEQLKNGSTVVIPNDPTNGGRSLLLLQKYHLIKLRKGVGLLPRLIDIVSNPKKLKFLEIEAPQLPRVLDDDKVTIAIINNNFAAQAGLNPKKQGLLIEDKDSPYVNVIVSRIDNKDDAKILNFKKAYQSVAVENAAKKAFKGLAIKGW